MRRGIRLLMTVATTAVVAVAFRASLQQPTTTTGAAAVVSSTTPPANHHVRRSTPSPKTKPTTPVRKSVVVAGGVVNTQYGPVQVEVSVGGGKIAKAHTLQHPSGDGRTDQINGYAVPQLDQETMTAQNAHIDTVSGATFTSEGYRQSLQSALDAAHRAGAL
ncbi:uncharacterized protein with FMN-binding domain [Kribbella aluminosa]|uniref:Uncharacterized protein with FMN-binding domain n=1 Tax=Kribbella aluminosa TaxID=416017 RepID=A0ABS4ULJ6_9ACTN|nr:FMN-binding protein [Kribbella aluminosa]MBP2352504.1 uncharacterized protein with FMN-binding domain [Kribbella aluminosa]